MKNLKIDIVSDVMCPWCIVGYKGLETALEQLGPDIKADITWLPFELNPQMPTEGQDMDEHIIEKYGITAEQSAQNREVLSQRGKDAGFEFKFGPDMRMINSFDLHRLLAWAKDQGKQHELQMAFFDEHFTENTPLDKNENLIKIINSIGLDGVAAQQVLDSNEYSDQVRTEQRFALENGINAVPSFIINDKHLISGGQSSDTFKQALQEIATEV